MLILTQNPQFRRLWLGGVFNDIGLTMYFMVHGWLMFSITKSAFWVGATAGMNGLAMIAFGVFGGVLADRVDRRKLLASSQLVQASIALALAIVVFAEGVELWHVLLVAFIDGAAVTVKVPSRMALTLDLAGRARALSAIAAGYASMTAMAVIVPLAGGAVINAFGIAWAYVIMAGAYLVAAATVMSVGPVRVTRRGVTSPWRDLTEGVRYAFKTPVVRTLIVAVIVTEVFGWAHESMLPVMAGEVLGAGALGLGYLLAAGGAGATVALLVLSALGDVRDKGRLVVIGAGGFGILLAVFAFSTWLPLSMVLLAGAYALMMLFEPAVTTLLQTTVPDDMRGRVLSFQTMSWGLTGVSGFHTGAIARALGAPAAIAIGGAIVALNSLRMAVRTRDYQDRPTEAVSER